MSTLEEKKIAQEADTTMEVETEVEVEKEGGSLEPRGIAEIFNPIEQSEGVGARVKRLIGNAKLRNLDPFLMLDIFKVKAPAGFPDHPHRGFETITYMLEGEGFKHEDNKGHAGVIGVGDLQWMTAGSGLVHSEMPIGDDYNIGIQLWVNLHSSEKMTKPQYQELKHEDIPVGEAEGVSVKVIAGESLGVKSEVFTRTPTIYLDVRIQKDGTWTQHVPDDFAGFVYVISGSGSFGTSCENKDNKSLDEGQMGMLGEGEALTVTNGDEDELRFVLIAGKPIGEPIVQYGPMVMNTQEEIQQAFIDFQLGRF
eukprot:TRINITY_DN10115_c0_g1_i1.p1 TRINITY_DN10115_c0_g1~~TRINITY_DN10115_c0_g1_i1.p1  ORF type:complete len:357 (-),score=124.22 TRINITY_DN10115_c0_g1_i1:56-985(-)